MLKPANPIGQGGMVFYTQDRLRGTLADENRGRDKTKSR
jgi:hypothetical protein